MRQLEIILVLLPCIAMGQQNLVQNSSFELFDHCPNQSGIYSINALNWIIPNAASPDYYNVCAMPNIFLPDTHQWPNMGVPANVFGNQPAHSGDAYIGIYCYSAIQEDLREYIQIQLTDSIIPSIRYEVSFYVSFADQVRYSINTIGAYFSKESVFQDDVYRFNLDPQILNTGENPLTSKEDWVLITDTFNSRYGGERYLTIGNFNTDGTSDTLYNFSGDTSWIYAYYYIDDVSVIALDSIPSGLVEEEYTETAFRAYPNPSNGLMQLDYVLNEGEKGTLSVFSVVGQLLLQKQLDQSQSRLTNDMNSFGSGTYLLRVDVNGVPQLLQKISIVK